MTSLRRGDADLHDPVSGEHRTTARTANGSELERHERRIAAHLREHKARDAIGSIEYNPDGSRSWRADLIQSDRAVHDLALRAEQATNGVVRFQYATAPSATTYWVFDRGDDTPVFDDVPYFDRMNTTELVKWLTRVIAWAESRAVVG